MISLLALLAGFAFIFWLINVDRQLRRFPSAATWIPVFLLGILCSRSVASWFYTMGIGVDVSAQGNSVDSLVHLLLIVAATITLFRRGFKWGGFSAHNKALVFIYLYLACTSLWADDPATTLKRVIKNFECVLTALVILTELNPLEVIRTIFVRMAYVMFTLSVVFIKYFPDIGRSLDRSGSYLFAGVTTHKNTLGLVVLVLSLFVVADIFTLLQQEDRQRFRLHLRIRYGIIAMGIWLLITCQSMTSLIGLVLGIAILWASRMIRKLHNPRRVFLYAIIGSAILYLLQSNFQVISNLMIAVGRDPTMTGRTEIWDMVFDTRRHPALGYGYYSYWESAEATPISELFKGTLKTLHSGYLEMLVDCGIVGLILLLFLLIGWGYRAVDRSAIGTPMGRLSLVFWTLALIYNYSETSFFREDSLWFALLLLMMQLPSSHPPINHDTPLAEQPLSA